MFVQEFVDGSLKITGKNGLGRVEVCYSTWEQVDELKENGLIKYVDCVGIDNSIDVSVIVSYELDWREYCHIILWGGR